MSSLSQQLSRVRQVAPRSHAKNRVSLLFEQRNILRVVRKGMKEGTHFVWMRDPETFRQLQQRVNDNQEFDVQETSAVTALSNIRHMLVTVIAPPEQPTSLHGFLENFATLRELNEDHMPLLASWGNSIMAVDRVYTDVSVRAGAKDVATLNAICQSGEWICRQPLLPSQRKRRASACPRLRRS